MAAISSIFDAFVSGQLNASWTHGWLLGGAISAEILLAIGIWLESPKNKHLREWLGLGLVFGGVVVSAACTIGLFVFDEGISNTQLVKIAALETRIAQRELTADQIEKLQKALAEAPPTVPHKVVFVTFLGDFESQYLQFEIGRYFVAANWQVDLEARTYNGVLAWGIGVWGPDNETRRAVRDILEKADIVLSRNTELPTGFSSVGHQPQPGDIDIFVGPKFPVITPEEAARAGVK